MPRRKKKPSSGTEYCSGFRDEHGQWNNGFYCPKWGQADIDYCCGPKDHKYCCPKEETAQPKLEGHQSQHVSLVIGLAVGSLLLLMATVMLSCCFCRCCWGYKKRKRLRAMNTGFIPASAVRGSHRPNYAVSYAVCPHGTLLQEFMMAGPHQYPREDPPPYPGGPAIPLEEKAPLRRAELGPGEDTPHQLRLARAQTHHRHNRSLQDVDSEKSTASTVDLSPMALETSMTKDGEAGSKPRFMYSVFQRELNKGASEEATASGADDSCGDEATTSSEREFVAVTVRRSALNAEGSPPWTATSSVAAMAGDDLDCVPGPSTSCYCADTWPLSKSGFYHKVRATMAEVGPSLLDSPSSSSGSYTG